MEFFYFYNYISSLDLIVFQLIICKAKRGLRYGKLVNFFLHCSLKILSSQQQR